MTEQEKTEEQLPKSMTVRRTLRFSESFELAQGEHLDTKFPEGLSEYVIQKLERYVADGTIVLRGGFELPKFVPPKSPEAPASAEPGKK